MVAAKKKAPAKKAEEKKPVTKAEKFAALKEKWAASKKSKKKK